MPATIDRHNPFRLVGADEKSPTPVTGRQVLDEMADLLAERLPAVPVDDPCAASLRYAYELLRPRRR